MRVCEFSQEEVRQVIGEEWNLGRVWVQEEVHRAMKHGTFLETILQNHLFPAFTELDSHPCVVDALEKAIDSGQCYATHTFWHGKVFRVESDPSTKVVEVTLVDDNDFCFDTFRTTFKDVLLERELAEFEDDEEKDS